MRAITFMACAAALLAGAQTVSAQVPRLALEVRGTAAVPTGQWNDEDLLDTGFGGGATVTAMFSERQGVYAGWERIRFPVNGDEAEDEDAAGTDSGFRAGLASFLPISALPNVAIFAELGLVYNTFELSSSDGGTPVELESDASLGYETGVGLAVRAAPRLDVTPIVRYRQYKPEFDGFEDSETVKYFSWGVGLRLRI
ncbi:MAG TPA: outer membrane beta-barrel protein [Longimicrobium sp.]|nr:outer membrane beta-barrel protein [Longimicrobium sp.]